MFVQKYVRGGSAPTPPAGIAIPAPCIRIQSNLFRVFASLFAKRERVSGQRPENSKRKKMFAHFLQMSVYKKATENNNELVAFYLYFSFCVLCGRETFRFIHIDSL